MPNINIGRPTFIIMDIMDEKKTVKIIGLTGYYCAGKNHIARLLQARGLAVLDVDKLGHEVINEERVHLAARFGSDILDEAGNVHRARLGAKVFGKAVELAALEEIIHPVVNRRTLAWIAGEHRAGKSCVINAALLHRTAAFGSLDAIILVQAGFLTRLFRARKRDRLPLAVLLKRFSSQREFRAQYSSGNADIYKVENSWRSGFTSKGLEAALENRINAILSLAGIGQVANVANKV